MCDHALRVRDVREMADPNFGFTGNRTRNDNRR